MNETKVAGTKRVAVIGAGASGLAATKICLDYGIDAVCFEKTADLGGVWRYKSHDCKGEASVMKSTVANTSKEMMAYSDFPPPAAYPNFWHNRRVLHYFRMYANHFGLRQQIRFNSKVHQVAKAVDYVETGRWDVRVTDTTTGEEATDTFDGVFICNGHFAEPYMAHFKGEDHFKGQIMHSHSYKDHCDFEDKRVVIVGVGNSAGDIAVELGRTCSQVYLVSRRGAWIVKRIGYAGLPADALTYTRSIQFALDKVPSVVNDLAARMLNTQFDHTMYGLKPEHEPFGQLLSVNDDLPNQLASGNVVVKPPILHFGEDGHSIAFQDGSRVENIDVVIVATGYSIRFPMLADATIIDIRDNECSLYKNMYPPRLPHPSLVVIGLVQPLGALMPISEMQSRVACEFLLGRVPFPAKSIMLDDIAAKKKAMRKRYAPSRRHTVQVDYVRFMDDLATIIGAKPTIGLGTMFRDPKLFLFLVFGPTLPYHYRLEGPHRWKPARETILTVFDRISAGYRAGAPLTQPKGPTKLSLYSTVVKKLTDFLKYLLSVYYFNLTSAPLLLLQVWLLLRMVRRLFV